MQSVAFRNAGNFGDVSRQFGVDGNRSRLLCLRRQHGRVHNKFQHIGTASAGTVPACAGSVALRLAIANGDGKLRTAVQRHLKPFSAALV